MKYRRYYIEGDDHSLLQKIKNRTLGKKIRDFPESIVLETIAGCNAKCIFCSQEKARRGLENGRISDELFQKIADECSRNTDILERFSFAFDNEPLLDKTVASKVKYIKKVCPDVATNITTNGILLTPERIKELYATESLDEFNISIQGITRPVYEKLMGVKAFDRVMENMDFLSDFTQTHQGKTVRIEINTCLTDETIFQKDKIEEFWSNKGFKSNFVTLDSRSKGVKAFHADSASRQYYKYCKRPFHTMVICWDGIVPLCCADYGRKCIMGDVSQKGLAEVWKSHAATQARREMITGEFSYAKICEHCEIGA